MKHIELFEWFSQKSAPVEKRNVNKNDYTFKEYAKSKIDPSKDVVVKIWMDCPVCSSELKDMSIQGEVQQCKKCKTKMQIFGTNLKINNVTMENFDISNIKKEPDTKYTSTHTMEHLKRSDYVRGNQMICPLCGTILDSIDHGEKITCHECGLKMEDWGNSLKCRIDNSQLELYSNLKKYNL
jgi:hypothetical protein